MGTKNSTKHLATHLGFVASNKRGEIVKHLLSHHQPINDKVTIIDVRTKKWRGKHLMRKKWRGKQKMTHKGRSEFQSMEKGKKREIEPNRIDGFDMWFTIQISYSWRFNENHKIPEKVFATKMRRWIHGQGVALVHTLFRLRFFRQTFFRVFTILLILLCLLKCVINSWRLSHFVLASRRRGENLPNKMRKILRGARNENEKLFIYYFYLFICCRMSCNLVIFMVKLFNCFRIVFNKSTEQ